MAKTQTLLTITQAASRLGLKKSTLYQKVWRRELEHVKLGKSLRFREEMIDQLIAQSIVPAVER